MSKEHVLEFTNYLVLAWRRKTQAGSGAQDNQRAFASEMPQSSRVSIKPVHENK